MRDRSQSQQNDAAPKLADLIEERAFPWPKLPPPDALDDVERTLSAVWEFQVEPIAQAVIQVANRAQPNSITFEDIGRLVTWANNVRERAEDIVDAVAKVAVVAHEAFDLAAGCHGDGTMFTDHGVPEEPDWFAEVRRKRGF